MFLRSVRDDSGFVLVRPRVKSFVGSIHDLEHNVKRAIWLLILQNTITWRFDTVIVNQSASVLSLFLEAERGIDPKRTQLPTVAK